ncbi:MAG: hypothetical protein IJ877_03005 [Candidatus Gastranaerophilales bacterium]|nr:hypothetical protein [Candidatus Gastranaerophilales bacterium]
MNKKIILYNVIALLVLFALSEFAFYKNFCENRLFRYKIPYFYNTVDILKSIPQIAYYPVRFHPFPKNYPKDKKPILMLGCSYTFGQGLAEDETLAMKLQRLTGRWVYNMGVGSRDATVSLMLLEEEKKNPRITQKPEYIIYTYMYHHLQRVINWRYFNYYRQHGYIAFQKYNPLYLSYTYSYFKNRELENYLWNDWDYILHRIIFINMLYDMKKICSEMYPESKFIVLLYNDINYDLVRPLWESVGYNEYKMNKLFEILYSEEFKRTIEGGGLEVISTLELIKRPMDKPSDRVQNDANYPHPSSEVWDLVAPKLIERLKL